MIPGLPPPFLCPFLGDSSLPKNIDLMKNPDFSLGSILVNLTLRLFAWRYTNLLFMTWKFPCTQLFPPCSFLLCVLYFFTYAAIGFWILIHFLGNWNYYLLTLYTALLFFEIILPFHMLSFYLACCLFLDIFRRDFLYF